MIQVCRWSDFQHFKNRDPIWIKLYRKLRHDREWRTLPALESKLLVDLWMLAAEGENPGTIELTDEEIAWELRMEADDIHPSLEVIESHGFIKVISGRRQDDIPHALARDRERDREREEKETTAAEPPEEVETSKRERPAYTMHELELLAYERLGLEALGNTDMQTNQRILKTWLYGDPPRDPMDVALAIEGAADMRDSGLIGWDSAKPGTPMTLKALNGAKTLADQGDGKAQRTLWATAIDHARSTEPEERKRPPAYTKGSAPERISELLDGAA